MKHETGDNVLFLLDKFFEYYEFDRSAECFKQESALFRDVSVEEWRPLNYYKKKSSVMSLLEAGQEVELFHALESLLPETCLETKEYQRLEFNLHLFLATRSSDSDEPERNNERMQKFRDFLETCGAKLSQTTDFLPYYALPYAPDPRIHPVYKELYTASWRDSIRSQLAAWLDRALAESKLTQPRLVQLLQEATLKQQRATRQMANELADAEKRATQAQRRCSKIQHDYQTLLSVTADLLDALEKSLKGDKLEDDVMQKIYQRLMANQTSNQRFAQKMYDHLEANGAPTTNGTAQTSNDPSAFLRDQPDAPLFELDFVKIKESLPTIDDRNKCYLLQALRWRLTKTSVSQRDDCLTSFVRNDILDLTKVGAADKLIPERSPLIACLLSRHHRVREYMARFLNALASLCRGRAYLSQNGAIVRVLTAEVIKEKSESITRENLVGALQKLSLRRPMQTIMIEMGTIPWVVELLEKVDLLSDYTLEYAVALCMNLCLRLSGKRSCLPIGPRILKVLMDLLSFDNMDVVPYVNGALYSILALPEIRHVAKQMNLKNVLQTFIKPDRVEMNRQFDFIIRRLLSSENPINDNSDDEVDDDDDDEEDASTLESDLDRQDMPPPETNEFTCHSSSDLIDPVWCVGEGLLKHRYALKTTPKAEVTSEVEWLKPSLGRDNEFRASVSSHKSGYVLRRPSTPGQRSVRSSMSNSRPSTASKAVLNAEPVPALTEEHSHPLYLRDSLLTLSQGHSEENTPRASMQLDEELPSFTDNTPRASMQLDQEPPPVERAPREPELKKTEPQRAERTVSSRKEAFKSRPKIPRTPDATSPERFQIPLKENRSPDSTVTSTTSRDGDGPDADNVK